METLPLQQTVSPAEHWLGKAISWLFHPLFVPVVVVWLFLYQHPLLAYMVDDVQKLRMMGMVAINTVLFPALSVFLLWRLGFVTSVYLNTTRDRILPLSISLIFYFWAFWVIRNTPGYPLALTMWLLGIFLASSMALFFNAFIKISLHTIGMGGLIGFLFLQVLATHPAPVGWFLLALLIAGLTGTARLLCKAHSATEIYVGYLIGILAQLAAYFILR